MFPVSAGYVLSKPSSEQGQPILGCVSRRLLECSCLHQSSRPGHLDNKGNTANGADDHTGSFIQQVFLECVICTKHYSKHW